MSIVSCARDRQAWLSSRARVTFRKAFACFARSRWFALIASVLALTCSGARSVQADSRAEFTYQSASGIRFVVDAEGLRTISIGTRVVGRGGWHTTNAEPLFAAGAGVVQIGKPQKQAIDVLAPDHVRLRHVQHDLATTLDYSFHGDDLQMRARVENNHPTQSIAVTGFDGPTFSFGRAPAGMLLSWHQSYLQNLGIGICWPSHFAPIGGSYASDDFFGVGLTPLGTGLSRCMFHWSWSDPPAAQRTISYYVPAAIPPGGARTFQWAMRVSVNRDWKHLMQPYRQHFLATFGSMKYRADHRLMGYCVASDPTWVGPDNPLGFHPAGNFRRFDRPEGTKEFSEVVVKALRAADGQGLIGWALQGYEPRGALYRADFDIFPPSVEANLPILRREFAGADLRLGACARPGEIVYRHDWKQDTTVRINPDDPAHLEMIARRFHNMRGRGFNTFYLDTFGAGLDDVKAMRHFREQFGEAVPTYAEHSCDAILPYTGLYTYYRYDEKQRKHTCGLGDWMWDFYRWLMPEAAVIVQMQNSAPPNAQESTYRYLYGRHLTPLEADSAISAHAVEARALQREFLDEQGRWKK